MKAVSIYQPAWSNASATAPSTDSARVNAAPERGASAEHDLNPQGQPYTGPVVSGLHRAALAGLISAGSLQSLIHTMGAAQTGHHPGQFIDTRV